MVESMSRNKRRYSCDLTLTVIELKDTPCFLVWIVFCVLWRLVEATYLIPAEQPQVLNSNSSNYQMFNNVFKLISRLAYFFPVRSHKIVIPTQNPEDDCPFNYATSDEQTKIEKEASNGFNLSKMLEGFRHDFLWVAASIGALILINQRVISVDYSFVQQVLLLVISWVLGGFMTVWQFRKSKTSDIRLSGDAIIFNKQLPPAKIDSAQSPSSSTAVDHQPTEDPESLARNMPWILYNANLLHERDPTLQFENYRKVFIMGRYKVGKTQIANWLGMKDAKPSNTVNTRGELFYFPTSDGWAKNAWMVIDSEGFDQPIDTIEPEFKKVFMMEHAKQFADVILIVIPHLLITDLDLYLQAIDNLSGRGSESQQIIVIHNLQKFQNPAEICEYKKLFSVRVQDHYRFQAHVQWNKGNLSFNHFIVDQNGQNQSNVGLAVQHYFLGDHDIEEVRKHNLLQIDQIQRNIVNLGNAVMGRKSLLTTLIDSLKFAAKLCYTFEGAQDPKIRDLNIPHFEEIENKVKCLKFAFESPISNLNWLLIGNNRYLGLELLYEWGTPLWRVVDGRYGRMKYLPITFRLSKINDEPYIYSEAKAAETKSTDPNPAVLSSSSPCLRIITDARSNGLIVKYRQWKFTYPADPNIHPTDNSNFNPTYPSPQYIKIPGKYRVKDLPVLDEHVIQLEKSHEITALIPISDF